MRILNITLSNFLCYYGENNRLDFTDGLNIILGANGYGKSKLYDAFQWVFRNGITDDKPRLGTAANAIRSTPELKQALVNERALAQAEVGEKIKCEVCIEVTGTQSNTYQIVRYLYVNKTGEKEFKAAPDSHLDVFYKDVIDFKPLSDAEGRKVVEQLIPTDIMPYLWFQGERGINNLIDTSSRESLKQVVNKMSDIDKWDRFIEATQMAYTSADKELKQALSGDASKKQKFTAYYAQQKSAQAKLEVVDTEIAEAEKNYSMASTKHDNIIGQLTAASKISGLEKEREQRVKAVRQIAARLDVLKLGFTRRLFTDSWLLMGTENLVDKFDQKYGDYLKFSMKRQAEQIAESELGDTQLRLPKGIPDRVHVVDMLKREHCLVCDRPAVKGSLEYQAIEKLLSEPTKPKKAVALPDIELDLRGLSRVGFTLREKYSKALDEMAAHKQEEIDLEDERQELEDEIKSFSTAIATELLNSGLSGESNTGSSASSVLSSIDLVKRDLAKYSVSLDRLNSDREKLVASLYEIDNEFGKLSHGGGIDPKLDKKRKLLRDLHDLAERTKKTQYQSLIQQLEDSANDHFSRMNEPTGAVYGKIKFVRDGDGYVPEIHDDAGVRMDNLNTSQNSSSKLAIIMAIVTANEGRDFAKKYPLISDAPTSDFDTVKSRAFLAETARAFGQSIIIIKDFLDADPKHIGQYIADSNKLSQVKTDVEAIGKKLNVFQLVIPPGSSAQNRKSLSVQIIPLNVK